MLNDRFSKRNVAFDLKEKLEDVQKIMTSKAMIKGLSLLFEMSFDDDQ